MSIYKNLFDIQQKLIVPKNQKNEFGHYNYRSAEDIIEAVKKVSNCAVLMSDDLVLIGDRYYVKSTATLINDVGESVSATAFARESENRKGMTCDQLTGSCSSYSRKYALNALFAIDDTKDADTLDNRHELSKSEAEKQAEQEKIKGYEAQLRGATTMAMLQKVFLNVIPKNYHKQFAALKDEMKSKLTPVQKAA